jgi:hypothetical protein
VQGTTTWINVADTAIKIGLGALIGGAFGIWVALVNNRSQSSRTYLEKKRSILESVLADVESFLGATIMYWANLSNAVYKRDKGIRLTEADTKELKKLEQALFESFKLLGSCSAKLLLIGEEVAEAKLKELRTTVDDFFQIANVENPKATESTLSKHRELIGARRTEFYRAAGESFKKSV